MANIDLVGANGSISWTAGLTGGSDAPEEDRSCVVRGRISRPRFVTTRPGSLTQRVALGEYRGDVVIRVVATDDGTPPVPVTTVGTLRIFIKTTSTSQHYTFKVVVTDIAFGYNSLTGEAQFIDYQCSVTNTATTDTVVAT